MRNVYVIVMGGYLEFIIWKICFDREVKYIIDYVWYIYNLGVIGCLKVLENDCIFDVCFFCL